MIRELWRTRSLGRQTVNQRPTELMLLNDPVLFYK